MLLLPLIKHFKYFILMLIKINNNGFLTAAADYMEKFPYTFTEKTKSDRHKRLHTVVVTLSDQTYKKLRNYTNVKETGTINVAGRNVIEKYLKLWEFPQLPSLCYLSTLRFFACNQKTNHHRCHYPLNFGINANLSN